MHNNKIIDTARLRLRPIAISDSPIIFSMRSDSRMNTYVHIQPPPDLAAAEAHVRMLLQATEENRSDFWMIEEAGSQEVFGSITLWNYDHQLRQAEIGFGLIPVYWGKGYMTEAIRAIIPFGRSQLGFIRIEGWTHRDNVAAQKVLQNGGMHRDMIAESRIDPNGPEKDFQIWAVG